MINNSLFKLENIPKFHPIINKFERIEFYKTQKRRCMEGYWVGGKWMCGELYYYINFHKINIEKGSYKGLGLPFLRDIDHEMFQIFTEAIGFSGFELDDEYTCHRAIKLLNEGETTINDIKRDLCYSQDGVFQDYIFYSMFKKDNSPKTYIEARDYLNKIHSKNLGKPLYLNESKHLMLLGARGFGKAVPIDTQVVTLNGNIKIDDINPGDKVVGRDGLETTVLSKHYQGVRPVYKFTLADGRTVKSDEEHLWGVYKWGKYKVLTTKEIVESKWKHRHKRSGHSYAYAIPPIEPVNYPKKDLPLDPYIVGCMIGDGTTTGSTLRISTDDFEIVEEFKNRLEGFRMILDDSTNNWRIVDDEKCEVEINSADGRHYQSKIGNRFTQAIKSLNLNVKCYNKFIPKEYLLSSYDQRLELLRGLLDTDGSINKYGSIEFTSVSEELANNVASLCRSLGIRCQVGQDNRLGRKHILPQGTEHTTSNICYRVFIRTDLPVFRLSRKLSRIKPRNTFDKVSIIDIEKVANEETVCITIDNKDKLFLIEDYIPTHNSYSASGLIAHNYLFDGCHDYDLYQKALLLKEPLKSETGVGAIDAKYSGDLLNKVKTAIDNLPDSHILQDGRFQKKYPSLLYREYEGSFAPSKRIRSLASGSEIHHRTLQDNPLVFNGTRPNRIFLDEVGFINNLLEAWEGIEATQASESFKRLSIIGMGTGGLTAGGAAMYSHEIFYNPEQYGCLVFEDIWENKGKIGKFVPATHALNKYKEGPNLVTNEERALTAINKEREIAKKSPTRTKLMGTIINKPIVPSEIFLRMEGTFFPVADFKNRLMEVESTEGYMNRFYRWELDLIENKVVPRVSEKHPIREFPLPKGFSMDAPIEVFELPKTLADGSIPYGRYLAGWDVIDHDGNDDVTQSLQSMFILDSWTDRIVAEYTARTYLVDEYYEQARRLLIMFNAICNYESNKKGPYAYFRNKNSLHLLCETPEILKDMQVIKTTGVGNKSLGTNTNEKVTNFGLNLLLTYYESQAYDKQEGVRNLDIINSPGLIKETISYSKDINTDRVSALLMLMILREDRYKHTQINKTASVKTRAQDPFWSKPFKNKHIKSIGLRNF